MSVYYGDYATGTVVYMDFDSFAASTGAPTATSNFAAGDIQIYKDGGTTQRSSSAGITVSTSFDGQTGLQMVAIDLSDNTDAGFYAAGHEYNVAVADVTIDSQTMRFWLGAFSIQRSGGALAKLLSIISAAGVNVTQVNGTNQTARDLGASVLLSSGTGTGQISLSSGAVLLQATQSGVTIPTVTTVTNQLTAAAIATGIWQDSTAGDFTTASSIGKSLYTSGVVPGAAGGLFIAGTNAATTVNFTGNMSGSVGSVTGAVGSVTGAVGSVTGNVGGNVVGSVASVTAAVTVGTIQAAASNIKKNTAIDISFPMTDSTTHVLATGLTVTATRSIDGAAFAACANAVTEISGGVYNIALAAADTNGNSIMYKFTATGADDRLLEIITQP